MHNRTGTKVQSREISIRDGAVLVPLVLVILFLALYPQLALHRSEGSVKTAVFEAQALAHDPSAQFHFFSGAAALSTNQSATVTTSEGATNAPSAGGTGEGAGSESAEAAAGEGATGESATGEPPEGTSR
jgi:hypothetical protein